MRSVLGLVLVCASIALIGVRAAESVSTSQPADRVDAVDIIIDTTACAFYELRYTFVELDSAKTVEVSIEGGEKNLTVVSKLDKATGLMTVAIASKSAASGLVSSSASAGPGSSSPLLLLLSAVLLAATCGLAPRSSSSTLLAVAVAAILLAVGTHAQSKPTLVVTITVPTGFLSSQVPVTVSCDCSQACAAELCAVLPADSVCNNFTSSESKRDGESVVAAARSQFVARSSKIRVSLLAPPAAAALVAAKDIALVTMLTEGAVAAYNPYEMYEELSSLTLPNMQAYAACWGHPFFFVHPLVPRPDRQAYWHKIDVMEHYLELGYPFVAYFDIDVVFSNFLHSFAELIRQAGDAADVIGVDECVRRTETNSAIRSGFLILRNSAWTRSFVRTWKTAFEAFSQVENPEQSALEMLFAEPDNQRHLFLHSWQQVHAYDYCLGAESSFSVHFPGHFKTPRVARMLDWTNQQTALSAAAAGEAQPGACAELKLAHAAAAREANVHMEPVREDQLPAAEAVRPLSRAAQAALGECVRAVHDRMTFVRQRGEHASSMAIALPPIASTVSASFASAVASFDKASYFFAIPQVLYMTLPDARNVAPSVQANIDSWVRLNPGLKVVLYGDADAAALVLSVLPELGDVWEQLLPVQRADIFRYAVIFLMGGYYADSDVECRAPIASWGHSLQHDTFVCGVEAERGVDTPSSTDHEGAIDVFVAQYMFGAAAKHPALGRMLQRLAAHRHVLVRAAQDTLSSKARLDAVLATSGPVFFTESLDEYICYTGSRGPQPLATTGVPAHGGQIENMRIFNVSCFGAGQAHSHQVPIDGPGVCVLHQFGGSAAFAGGRRWQQVEASE